jgi:hypothetical protein
MEGPRVSGPHTLSLCPFSLSLCGSLSPVKPKRWSQRAGGGRGGGSQLSLLRWCCGLDPGPAQAMGRHGPTGWQRALRFARCTMWLMDRGPAGPRISSQPAPSPPVFPLVTLCWVTLGTKATSKPLQKAEAFALRSAYFCCPLPSEAHCTHCVDLGPAPPLGLPLCIKT